MKFLKSILSLVLCIAIMVTTAVLAFAAGEFQPYDPELQPVITQQPHDITINKYLFYAPVYTDLEASIPKEFEKVSYELYRVGRNKDKLISSHDDSQIHSPIDAGEYYFVVGNYYRGGDTRYYVKSDTFKVETQRLTLKDLFAKSFVEIGIPSCYIFLLVFAPIIRFFNSIFKTA